MPEELTEEQTHAAFALLRAEALTHIRPPGAAEALQTVRRRRRAAVAAVAAGVGIAVAGGAAVANVVDADQSAPPPAAPSPSPSPSALSAAQLHGLASRASAALGLDSIDNRKRKREGKGQILMSSASPILPTSRPPKEGSRRGGRNISGTGSNLNKTGLYVLEILCVGEGTLHVRFWGGTSTAGRDRPTPPPGSPDLRVPCGAEPTPTTASVVAPWPATVYVSIEADQAAVGRAAVASLVRMP